MWLYCWLYCCSLCIISHCCPSLTLLLMSPSPHPYLQNRAALMLAHSECATWGQFAAPNVSPVPAALVIGLSQPSSTLHCIDKQCLALATGNMDLCNSQSPPQRKPHLFSYLIAVSVCCLDQQLCLVILSDPIAVSKCATSSVTLSSCIMYLRNLFYMAGYIPFPSPPTCTNEEYMFTIVPVHKSTFATYTQTAF